MSEVASEASVNAEITDSQVKEFFEEGKEPVAEEQKQEQVNEIENALQETKPETPKEERKVNYGALHEERMRRKELQSKIDKMEQRFAQLVESITPKKELPALEENPVEHFNSRITGIESKFKEQTEIEERTRQEREIVNSYQHQASVFASENADFGNAYKHFISSRVNELQAIGYTPQEAAMQVQNEELSIAKRAFEYEQNPAALIYEAAKARGYKKAEPAPVEKKIETIAKGVAASKISGGSSVAAPMTLEALANMDDEEFMQNWDKIVGNSTKF